MTRPQLGPRPARPSRLTKRERERHLKAAREGIEACEAALRMVGPCPVYERSLRHWRRELEAASSSV